MNPLPDTDRARQLLLVGLMAGACLLVGTVAILVLYQTAVGTHRDQLLEAVLDEARWARALDRANRAAGIEGPARLRAVRRRIEQVHRDPGESRTRILYALREGGAPRYLVGAGGRERVPSDDSAMQRALAGQRGTTIERGADGQPALAAYAWIDEVELAVVARTDLERFQARYVEAGLLTALATMVVVLLGSVVFFRVSGATFRRLAETATELEAVLESVAQGIVAATDDRIELFNAGAARLFGHTAESIVGEPLATLFAPETRAEQGARVDRLLAEEGRRGRSVGHGHAFECVRADGATFPAEITLSSRRHRGRFWTVLAVRDVSERARLLHELEREREGLAEKVEARTAALREVNRHLETVSRHKSRFLSNMSHELRTPLNAIIGFADLLRGEHFGPLTERQARYVAQIDESGKHLLSLINDLLDIAKIDADAIELRRETVAVREVCEAVLAMMDAPIAEKRLETALDTADVTVEADPRRLRQILLNLLANAVKFTPVGGRVALRVAETDMRVRFEVEDTGVGIAPRDHARVFDEFQQAQGDDAAEGTGIGLALTRRLVELHGGEIGVDSAPGEGSRFWFTLPTQRGRRARVLVVEDNETNLALVLDLLSLRDYEVMTARDGVEALEVFEAGRPDLVLMDMRMPRMDGIEATQRIRALPGGAGVRIVAVTASTGGSAEERQTVAGCDAHLAKPIDRARLFATIDAQLG